MLRTFFIALAAASGATLTTTPATVTECTSNGLGRVTLTWSGGSGPVNVTVGSRLGQSRTGPVGPSGSASTGEWVTDGMRFFLVNASGAEEALASARVRCGGVADPAVSDSYFPLQVGNRWVYRYNSRQITSTYASQIVSAIVPFGGRSYYLISNETGEDVMRVRQDTDGRVWRLTTLPGSINTGPFDQILFDPTAAAPAKVNTPLGTLANALRVVAVPGGLLREESVYAKGVGLVQSVASMLSGSSGGFVAGLELVEARLDGGTRLVVPASQLSLSIESTTLGVTGRKVTNCAVPSYCVACGLIGADAPGTYKSCAQVRVEGAWRG